MEFNFLNKHRIFLPDQYANERSPKSPHSLAERLTLEVWEVEEITLLRRYLSPDDSVIEMGACIGVLSVVTNSMLGESSKHVVVEADPKLIPVLEKNREMNNSRFEIINAIAGVPSDVEQQFRTSNFILGGSQLKETGNSITLPVVGLSQFKDDFNFLILDIEGGEYHFIDTFIEEIRSFQKLLIEFHPSHGYTKDDVNRYIAKLRGQGFKVMERIGHTVMFVKSPPREMHYFCETVGQVGLARRLVAETGPAGVNAGIFALDLEGDLVSGMQPEIDLLEASTRFVNVLDLLNKKEREWMGKSDAKGRAGMSRDVIFDYLRHLKDERGLLVVMFDDSSVNGHAVSQICRSSAIQRILVQEDFFGFISRTDSLENSVRNSRFGNSRPELACVWGPYVASRLIGHHHNHPARVKIVGCTLPGVKLGEDVSSIVAGKPDPILRILWVDQAITDSGKASRLAWLRDFKRLADVLSEFDCRYLPDPSMRKETLSEIKSILAPGTTIIDRKNEPEIDTILKQSDVCITYHSSSFLQCITRNVPCVFVGMDSLDVEMPKINHPLLFRAKGPETLRSTIHGIFNPAEARLKTGCDLHEFVSGSSGLRETAGAIADFLTRLESDMHGARGPAAPTSANGPAGESIKSLLAIGGSFGTHLGVGMSMAALYEIRNTLPIRMSLHLCNRGNVRRLKAKVLEADYIVFNSLEVVDILSTIQLNDLITLCHQNGKKVFLYLHETNFTWLRLWLEQPEKIENLLRCVLPTVNILCVSEAQARWIKGLGAGVTGVVYEAVAVPFDSRPEAPPRLSCGVVTMVGTIQPRKGVTLFSRTADLAKLERDALEFQWLGQRVKYSEKCYLSENVRWRGFLAGREFWDALLGTDVFVLSSVDDPFPLSVGQALFLGKPCIVYRDSGFAEVIERNHWGEVYDVHDAEDLYRKIRMVIDNPAGYLIRPEDVKSLLSVEAFAERLVDLVGSMPDSPCFDKEIVRSRVGDAFLDECVFFQEDRSAPPLPGAALSLHVDHKHFEIGGVVPETIRDMATVSIKPLDMAKGLMAIGRHDIARIISETCLRKTPNSKSHQLIAKACPCRASNPAPDKAGKGNRAKTGKGFRLSVSHKCFEINGKVPREIVDLDEIDLKPVEMANLLLAIGHLEGVRTISEACLLKNPASALHKELLKTCGNPPSQGSRSRGKPRGIEKWILKKLKTRGR